MAFNVKATLDIIEGYLNATGFQTRTIVGEFKQPPQEEISAQLTVDGFVVTKVYASGRTEESHRFRIRLMMDMLHEPTSDIEYKLAAAVGKITDDLFGDFDLGSKVRVIDAAGMNGVQYSATWGYVTISDRMYRTVEIVLPLNVDDATVLVA